MTLISSVLAKVLFLLICLQVTLDIVHADTTSPEEPNATETAKTYKVNCDKRNITGIKDFTVQVLNISQVCFHSGWNPFLEICFYF